MKPIEQKLPFYLLAAPIGDHLGDLSVTGAKLIGKLKLLFVEDTGGSGDDSLVARLKAAGIIGADQKLLPMEERRLSDGFRAAIDSAVAAGTPFGMIVDRGICGFVDPGVNVVRHLLNHHTDSVDLVPIGASSAMDAAIMMSGVDCDNFVFMGHFPENIRWFTEPIFGGIPGVAYVRHDSVTNFWMAAQWNFGIDSGLFVSVFKNIRGRQNRFHGRFPLSLQINGPESMTGDLEELRGTVSDSFVFMLHHPWGPEDGTPT